MDNITKMASGFLGGADPAQAAGAASDHVAGMDSGELADHLQQSVGSLGPSSLQALGQHLLSSFTNSTGGDADAAAQAAGTTSDAIASGSPSAISALIDQVKNNPGALQSAASNFLGSNPGAIASLAPGLLSGIMAKLGGN
jgi:hypothetical protein